MEKHTSIFGEITVEEETDVGGGTDDSLTEEEDDGEEDEQLVGGAGNDSLLVGMNSSATLSGGQGDDIAFVPLTASFHLDGGGGTDTLALLGDSGTFDLTALPDSNLQGLEVIDLTGLVGGTLILNQLEVLNLSNTSNTLKVRTDGDDTIEIGSGWNQGIDRQIGSELFEVYRQGEATLLVLIPVDFGDAPTRGASDPPPDTYPTLFVDQGAAAYHWWSPTWRPSKWGC